MTKFPLRCLLLVSGMLLGCHQAPGADEVADWLQAGQFERVIEAFRGSLPEDGRSRQLLAEAYARSPAHAAEGLEVLGPAIEGADPELALIVSRIALAADRIGEALRWLDSCRQRHPERLDVLMRLGELYFRLGRHEDTLALLEPLDSRDPEVLNMLGLSELSLGRSERGRALLEQSVTQARSAGTESPAAHFNLGLHHLDAGRFDAALAELRVTARVAPTLLDAPYQIMGIAERTDQEELAASAAEHFAALYRPRLQAAGALDETKPSGTRPRRPVVPGGATGVDGAPPTDRPNVLLISLDTLRADRLGCYGAGRDTSPAIDRLAREGLRFARAEAASNWTLPSHYSMMSGLTPAAHGVLPDFGALRGYDSPELHTVARGSGREQMLAESFKEAGYRTVALTENGWVSPRFGFDQGFDDYRSDTKSSLPQTLRATLAALRGMSGDPPWFAFVHTYAPHQPYHAPPRFRWLWADPDHVGFAWPRARVPITEYKRFRMALFPPSPGDVRAFRDLYDGQVAWADTLIQRLVAWLEAEGVLERTLVVVTSDHGEEIFERGRFDHFETLYEEVSHVPLVIRAPGRVPASTVVEDTVSLIDLPATLLDLAGLGDSLGQGRSLRPLWQDRPAGTARPVFAQTIDSRKQPVGAVWSGPLKYSRRTTSTEVLEELFDLRRDPGEVRNLASLQPDDTRRLRELLDRHLQESSEIRDRLDPPSEPLDPETLERLRNLGYVN